MTKIRLMQASDNWLHIMKDARTAVYKNNYPIVPLLKI